MYITVRWTFRNRNGEARFDNWTLVAGSEPKGRTEVVEPLSHPVAQTFKARK
jgi:hypothetical protein